MIRPRPRYESFRNFLKLSDIDDKILTPEAARQAAGDGNSKNNLAMIAEEKKEYSAAEDLL